MSERAEVGRTVIGRLRLRGTDLDPLSARLRMESLLSGAHLSPVGLPPSATVCIRRLVDPKPGTLPLQRPAPRPPPAWDEALGAALQAQLARAARPAHGPVPPSAEAVLFLDPAELLACLASDVVRGTTAIHWWWQGLFPSGDLARRMVAEWLRRPEYVPAALELAARRHEARPVLSLFSVDEARSLLVRACVTHGVPAVAQELARASEEASEPEVPVTPRAAAHRAGGSAVPGAPAPWEPWVPEAGGPGLSGEHRMLLGVSLLLRRAPMEARRTSFVPALLEWRREEARRDAAPREPGTVRPPPALSQADAPGPPPGASFEGAPTAGAEVPAERTFLPREPAPEPSPTPVAMKEVPRVLPLETRTEGPSGVAASERVVPPPSDAGPPPTVPPGAPRFDDSLTPQAAIPAPVVQPAALAPPPPPVVPAVPPRLFEPPPGRGWGHPISTGLGGLFYLVNLSLFLELYGDFSQPMFPHLALPVWDFVALLGRKLLVDPRPSDPVWKVLALLSGRKAGEAPGTGFEPPASWRVPAAWLRAFRSEEARVWTWSASGGRLQVWHPAGFPVLDVPVQAHGDEASARDGAETTLTPALSQGERGQSPAQTELAVPWVEAWVRGETETYSGVSAFTLERGEVPALPASNEASPLERWLSWVVPYARARLARALGLAPDDTEALARTLLTHDARLHVTETHVDVVLSLAQLPLEVRVAGLDRDIGWLPSAGRHLTFHFE